MRSSGTDLFQSRKHTGATHRVPRRLLRTRMGDASAMRRQALVACIKRFLSVRGATSWIDVREAGNHTPVGKIIVRGFFDDRGPCGRFCSSDGHTCALYLPYSRVCLCCRAASLLDAPECPGYLSAAV